MARKIVLRVAYIFPVLILVSIGTFALLEMVPGDPTVAILGESATPERVASLRAELGLDRPLVERYVDWIGGLLSGDLGTTMLPPKRDIADLVASRLPVTVELAVLAMLIGLVLAVPVGVLSAARAGERIDSSMSAVTFGLLSMPSFLLAFVLIFAFVVHPGIAESVLAAVMFGLVLWCTAQTVVSIRRHRGTRSIVLGVVGSVAGVAAGVALVRWFPALPRIGYAPITGPEGVGENLRTVLLPALSLGLLEAAVLTRVLRADMVSTLQEDFILAARATGLPSRTVLFRGALRPSVFSLITVAGVSVGRLLGGTVIVETIFNLPGMGRLLVDGILGGDYRLVQAIVIIIAVFYVVVNSLIDIGYLYIDPRLRTSR